MSFEWVTEITEDEIKHRVIDHIISVYEVHNPEAYRVYFYGQDPYVAKTLSEAKEYCITQWVLRRMTK